MEILDLQFYSEDLSKELSIKQYLQELLLTLWKEKEGFSGKRPFGNGGWEFDIYACLIKNNIIEGRFDEDGFIEDVDDEKGYAIILEAIKSL